MKKLFLLLCLIPSICLAGSLQQKHLGVIAVSTVAVAGGVCEAIAGQSCASRDGTWRVFRTGTTKMSIPITTTAARTICRVAVDFYALGGSAATTYRAGVFEDSAGEPNMASQIGGWSDSVAHNDITADSGGELVAFNFTGIKPSLSTTTPYHVVIETDTPSETYYLRLGIDSDDTCAVADHLSYDGAAWAQLTGQIANFALYSEE